MQAHDPVRLDVLADDLLALGTGITAFGSEGPVAGRFVSAAWFRTANGPFVVTVTSVDIVFTFEVFTLSIIKARDLIRRYDERRPQLERVAEELAAQGANLPLPPFPTDLSPPEGLDPWPFQSWRVEVLERLDWIADPSSAVGDFDPGDLDKLAPGELPPGTEHTCWTDVGLLFTGKDGGRLLVAVGDFPLDLLVTQDAETVEQYLKPCRRVSVEDYPSQVT